jgi:hypothetical protein
MKTVGCWLRKSAFVRQSDASIDEVARRLAETGMSYASIMLNDYAGKTTYQKFQAWSEDAIRMAAALRKHGLCVSLTTWVLPYQQFLIDMADELVALQAQTGAVDLILDAEEPWILAKDPMNHGEAAQLIGELLYARPLALTAIGTADDRVKPLADICQTWMPQCYATTKSQATAQGIVDYSFGQWRQKYGRDPWRWFVGLAAYQQPSPASLYMDVVLTKLRGHNVSEVCYWSHATILERDDIRAALPVRGSCVSRSHVIDLRDGSPTASPVVARMQGLLTAAALTHGQSVDPRGIDGKPGPRTLAALEAYQAKLGLPQTGICDHATWTSLLLALA